MPGMRPGAASRARRSRSGRIDHVASAPGAKIRRRRRRQYTRSPTRQGARPRHRPVGNAHRHQVGGADELVDERASWADRRCRRAEAHCSTLPRLSTAMRSAMLIASSWSCVTRMVVMPYSRCRRLTSICMSRRRFLSSAPNGSSSSRIFGIDGERARERDPLLLSAGKLRAASRSREVFHAHERAAFPAPWP